MSKIFIIIGFLFLFAGMFIDIAEKHRIDELKRGFVGGYDFRERREIRK